MFSVIFDMDGTLTDTQRICMPAWDFAGEKQGFKNMGKEIPNVCGMNEKGWTDYLLEKYKGLDYPQFRKDFRGYIIAQGKADLKEGAKEILEFLKQNNVRMALASGSSFESISYHLKSNEIFDYFEVIVSGGDVKNSKPHPESFLLAAERLGVDPADCFVFEDSSNGIISGAAAGMKCIGVADIVPFNDKAKSVIFKEYKTLTDAIPLLKEYLQGK